jgi:hypothetical protein
MRGKNAGGRSQRRDPISAAVWIISASVAVVESRNFRDSVAEIVSDGITEEKGTESLQVIDGESPPKS